MCDGLCGGSDLADNDNDGRIDEQCRGNQKKDQVDRYRGPDLDGTEDNRPTIANTDQLDLDEDGLGDACDDDRDGDGVDNAPTIVPTRSRVRPISTGMGLGIPAMTILMGTGD